MKFRKPEQITDAYQFQGDWDDLAKEIGWTIEQLVDRWPKVTYELDKDGQRVMVFSDRVPKDTPLIIEVGCWVIVNKNHIVGIASETAFADWERIN